MMPGVLRRLFLLLLLLPVLAGVGRAAPSVPAPAAAPALSGDPDLPEGYVLSAAYPNPFNPRTTFSLTVRDRQAVTVEVFTLLGQRVRTLFSGVMDAGETRTFLFEAGDLPSGIYLYRVQGQTFTATRQVTLLK